MLHPHHQYHHPNQLAKYNIPKNKTKPFILLLFRYKSPHSKKNGKTDVNRPKALLNILWPHLIKEHSITGIAQHAGPYPKIRFAQIKPGLTNRRQLFLAPRYQKSPGWLQNLCWNFGNLKGTSKLVIKGIAKIRHCCSKTGFCFKKWPGRIW